MTGNTIIIEPIVKARPSVWWPIIIIGNDYGINDEMKTALCNIEYY